MPFIPGIILVICVFVWFFTEPILDAIDSFKWWLRVTVGEARMKRERKKRKIRNRYYV